MKKYRDYRYKLHQSGRLVNRGREVRNIRSVSFSEIIYYTERHKIPNGIIFLATVFKCAIYHKLPRLIVCDISVLTEKSAKIGDSDNSN